MLFSSLPFLFGFLPLTILAVYGAMRWRGPRLAGAVLLCASLIFYSWQTPVYFFLIAGSIIFNFFLGRNIAKARSKRLLGAGVIFNLGLLGWFKYIGLFSSTIADLTRADVTISGVILPLAISFFTFQQIAYLADCHKHGGRNYSFLDYALFVAFFPQLIAGPIVHHKDLAPQFTGSRFAKFLPEDVMAGVFLFAIGLVKKVLIADGLAPLADGVFDAAATGTIIMTVEAWIGISAYSFQIYFDFSGYSDMALGLALLFGVRLPMNFNSPYKARSIVEFWRRWHITLSTFLRDYLYFPLGGNRAGGLIRYRNLFIVMLLGGLWHGAAWTFVAWGALHGFYLCINHYWDKALSTRVSMSPVVATIITFGAASLAWVFFRAANFDAAFIMLAALGGMSQEAAASVFGKGDLYSFPILFVAAALVWWAPNALQGLEWFRHQSGQMNINTTGVSGGNAIGVVTSAGLGALFACAVFILFASGPYEFIYFQF